MVIMWYANDLAYIKPKDILLNNCSLVKKKRIESAIFFKMGTEKQTNRQMVLFSAPFFLCPLYCTDKKHRAFYHIITIMW